MEPTDKRIPNVEQWAALGNLLDGKQDELTAGDGITIEDESGSLIISATGGGGGAIQLTSADYNHHISGDTDDGVALWTLNPGMYVAAGDVKVYICDAVGYARTSTQKMYLIGNTNASNKKIVFEIEQGHVVYYVVDTTGGIDSVSPMLRLYDMFADSAMERVKIGSSSSSTGNCSIAVGKNSQVSSNYTVAIGYLAKDSGGSSSSGSVIIGNEATGNAGDSAYHNQTVAIGDHAAAGHPYSVALGSHANGNKQGGVAIGAYSAVSSIGEMNIGTSNTAYGYNSSNYRLLTGLYDGQSAHDAATKGQLDSIAIQNAGAPTTSTVGTVGQLLEDTTNGKLYICTAVTPGTDPDPDTYTWEEVGAGGGGSGVVELTSADYNYPTDNPDGVAVWLLPDGIYHAEASMVYPYDGANKYAFVSTLIKTTSGQNSITYYIDDTKWRWQTTNATTGANVARGDFSPAVTQSTGTSTTDVMSQNATTALVYQDPFVKTQTRIGTYASTTSYGVAIGYDASVNGSQGIALGGGSNNSTNSSASGDRAIAIGGAQASGANSVALGYGAQATAQGQFDIGTSRTGMTTYGYNNSQYRLLTGLYDPQSAHDAATKGYVDPTTDSTAPTTATAGRLGQIQIDTSTATAYMCVAVDDVTPSYTWKQITA